MPKMKSHSMHGICTALLLIMMSGISACDLPQLPSQKEVEKKSDDLIKKTGPKVDEAAGIGTKNIELDPLAVSNDVWLGNQAIRMHTGKPLPTKFETNKGFTLVSAAPIDLQTVAMQITSATGIKTAIGDLTLGSGPEKVTSTSTSSSPSSSSTTSVTGATTEPLLPSLVQSTTNSISVSYSGPLSKFLDQVAAQMDVSWRYDGDNIYFYRYQSKTFVIEALASKISTSDAFSPSSSSSSSGSSGASSSTSDVTQTNSLKDDSDLWKDMEAAIKGILGGDGSEVMMPSSGTVVVTAKPEKLEEIGKYLQEENRRMTRQVAIDIVVYDVDVTNEDNYGVDLSNAFSFNSGGVGNTTGPLALTKTYSNGTVTSTGTQTTATGVPLTTIGVTSPSSVIATNGAANAGSLAISFLSSHWDASAIAKALSTLGHTVEVTRAPIVTLNNRAASRKIATDQTYIASQSATAATSTSAATQSITPGVATTGITLQVLPRLTSDDRILIQYSIIISALNGTIQQTCANQGASTVAVGSTSNTGGSSCIGTPNTTNKVFVQQALLQNGSTLVLAGFDDKTNQDKLEGIGSPYNWLMGGTDASKNHQHLVITMTPREITPDHGNS